MKLKQLITGGALAATVLTLGSVQAEQNRYDGVVFCKANIVATQNPEDTISITLPFSTNPTDGEQYTYWNLGAVPAGGVADTWHGEGGPGRFVAHNNGGMGAYVYLTSSRGNGYERWNEPRYVDAYNFIDNNVVFEGTVSIFPTPSLQRWRHEIDQNLYCLAFSRDVERKIPTWHMLNMFSPSGDAFNSEWIPGDFEHDTHSVMCIGAYMGYLDPGDYMPFDVKFWAPRVSSDNVRDNYNGYYSNGVNFTFMVEAAPFPLWEHDADVQ